MELLFIALLGGLLAGAIASGKNQGFGGYFIIGCLLPVIGVILAIAAKPRLNIPSAPHSGWWPDPVGRFDRRYFDGRSWTSHVTRDDRQMQLFDPI